MTTTMMSHDQQDRADEEVVLGVDTHKDWHVAVVVTAMGTRLGTASFPATSAGYAELLSWATGFGAVRRAGVEGTGSYGVSLTRFLTGAGVAVTEVNRPDRANRRRRGKSDPVDAEAAAHAVISRRATAVPKSSNGPVEQIRIFKLAKDSAVKAKRQAVNQMHALLVNADPGLREELSGLGRKALVTRCAAFHLHSGPGVTGATQHTLRTLARRVQGLDAEISDLTGRLEQLVIATAPVLLEQYGVGVDSAATLLRTVGDNPDRIHSDAAFAALCGVSPVDMSSGRTQRHRLNRGGDRQANAALYRILLTRLRDHPPTLAYVARPTTEGKSKRRIIRCLKRYLARHLFNLIRIAPGLSSLTPPTT